MSAIIDAELLERGKLDHRALALALLPTIVTAARIELAHAAAGVVAERKADCSPVTAADREAQEVIVAALGRLGPGIPVVAEEFSGGQPRVVEGVSFFLVDPLDGTRDYLAGYDDYTVNVALVTAGKPVFGIVAAPARGEVFATLGKREAGWLRLPAEADGRPAVPAAVAWQPLATRSRKVGQLVALTSRSHALPRNKPLLDQLGVTEVRAVGSAYKFCLLARGEADLYPRMGETNEWDVAAGHAVLAAAGGMVVGADGAAFGYGKWERNYLNPPFVAWGRPPADAARS